MKKLLPFIVPYELIKDDMITLQQIIVARAYVTLEQLKKYDSPSKYATNVLQQLRYKKTIPALFIIYDHKNISVYPRRNQKKIIDQINLDTSDDNSDMIVSTPSADDGDFYLSPKDMNKAMQLLQKEIGLINLKGKKEIKKNNLLKQKIELKGRPSVYKMPDIFAALNKVCSNELATRQVVKTLVNMSMLAILAFILEASFYAIKDGNTNRIDELFKVAGREIVGAEVKIDMNKFRLYKEYIQSLDESELRSLAINKAKEMLNHPELYGYILFSSLF